MLTYLVALLAFTTLATALGIDTVSGFTKDLNKGIQKEISAVKQPIDETITFIGSSQCSNVKKIVGVAYEQLDGDKEPDLNQLSLEYKFGDAIRTVINITSAPEVIPRLINFSPSKKMVIFVHGFTDNPQKASFSNISNALINTGEINILALDGSSLIHWLYLRSTTYVRFMGEKLGAVLAAIVKSGVDPKSIHLVGHSLGSHISSFTGKTFTELTGQRVGRITGLDPAGPCFSHIDPELRLRASDADFVDVIHTDGGVYGLKDPIGHVDFYPNSGSEQPGCVLQTCSHSRAWLYYSESVLQPKAFPAVKCKDWEAFKKGQCEKDISYMGYLTESSARGLYFLQTKDTDEPPYGLGEKGLVYENNEGILKNIGSRILG